MPAASRRSFTREGTLQRTASSTIVLAALAVLASALLSLLAYRSVRSALEAEFTQRLLNVSAAIASQLSAADIADVRLLGEEAPGYVSLQVLLEELRATTRVTSASVLDSARVALYDTRGSEFQREVSSFDTLAHAALSRALGGEEAVSAPLPGAQGPRRAAFSPVLDDGRRVAGVVAVETTVDYLEVLAALARTLTLATAIIALAIAVLAALFVRLTRSAARLERRLSRAENLAAMGRLTATLAHEIKNPLAIIRGSAQRLGRLEPEARRMADFVTEEADRLSNTVARYLQFARGGEEFAPGSVTERGDAIATLEATLQLLEGEFKARRVTLERLPGAPDAAPVTLDNESLKQVYLNLMLNALEALPEGGRITVGAAEHRGRFEVSVADNGPGIAPEVLQRLGAPFHTTKAKGSGLGLFLTYRLVRSAGGVLDIRGRPGEGTTCVVRLQRRKD
ncbi:MAG: hypothetical protein A2W00_10040 [Candidatus Eisenbacteria bacterium RBG_16_71_46]|nr:MAG: hypothetical protein A2W00_10040 [Candidatus Eisenbacteria bacterium RBG_16_71_46]OGF21953.1 MAG: hypothetical protein A2V63_04595 [Candidatus Eisenbacteria bacterium RBG_19FT_COMBO_70_11]